MLIVGSGEDDTISVWGGGIYLIITFVLFVLNIGSLRPCCCLFENMILGCKYVGVRPTGECWSIFIYLFLLLN